MNEDIKKLAEIGAVATDEIQHQLVEVSTNLEKIFRQNEDVLSRLNCGVCIMMTAIGKTNIQQVWGTDTALGLMKKKFEKIMKELSDEEE